MLIHQIHLTVQAGNGGNGCASYQQRNDRKKVPNGGDGGRGGDIIFRADANESSLNSFRFRQHILAESGGHGGSNRCKGKAGKELVVLVPVGTRLRNRERNLLIRDLVNPLDEVVVAAGGEGGVGNIGGKEATNGCKGDLVDLELDFRLRPDIAFVGLPNSGKSTLLNQLTRTHVKEESYPFSTKGPEIGIYQVSDYEKMMLCELPSVYQGTSEGRGQGKDFLVHLEYAKFIFYVIDAISDFVHSVDEGIQVLKEQIGLENERFLKIPHGFIINKIDLVENEKAIKLNVTEPVFFISAKTGDGMDKLKFFLKQHYQENEHARQI